VCLESRRLAKKKIEIGWNKKTKTKNHLTTPLPPSLLALHPPTPGTSCLWKEYLEVDPGAGDAPLQGRAIAPDDSSVIEACSDEQWAKNPDGGFPEKREFNPGACVSLSATLPLSLWG
jgi:hypothetical protein